MKAAVVAEDRSLEIKDVPVPVPGEGQVLVKVATVAQNPTDCELRFVMIFPVALLIILL
jgi:NADPH:quinone reductase-like Zn-dependent oxidoreductase